MACGLSVMHSSFSQISPVSQSLVDVQLSPVAASVSDMDRTMNNTRSAPTFFIYW